MLILYFTKTKYINLLLTNHSLEVTDESKLSLKITVIFKRFDIAYIVDVLIQIFENKNYLTKI